MPRNEKAPGPTLDEWRTLYAAAEAFRERAPWTSLGDQALVIVEDPDSDESAYCCVMGGAEIEYGLLAYRGAQGLLGHMLLIDDALDRDEMLLVPDFLSFSLGESGSVDRVDRAVHRGLGLRFRGAGKWPSFRSHRPNLIPAYLERTEATLLATCLQQTSTLVQEIRDGATEELTDEEFYLRRVNPEGNWETAVATLPALIFNPYLPLDETGLAVIQGSCKRTGQTWELGLLAVVPMEDEDGGPDYWARALFCVDRQTGMILGTDLMGPEADVETAFIGTIEKLGALPAAVNVTSGLLQLQLSATAEALGIKMNRVPRNREFEVASKAMKQAFRRPGY